MSTNDSSREKNYTVDYEVTVVIKGECIVQESGNEQLVLTSIDKQLRNCGLIDFTTDKCTVVNINKLNVTPVEKMYNTWRKIGDTFNIYNLVQFMDRRINKRTVTST
jgi:hypothetical protein